MNKPYTHPHQHYIHRALIAILKCMRTTDIPESNSIHIEIIRSDDQAISYRASISDSNNITHIIAANTIQPKELRII